MVIPIMNHNEQFSLEGKVAWVTGSTKGLGRAMALALGEAGARIAINYHHDETKAQATLEAFKEAGCEGLLVKGDVTDEAQVNTMVETINQELGPVDIAVLNATCDQPHHPIEEYSWDFYQSMLDFFIKSPFLISRAILPGMKKKHWGRIINIGSEVLHWGFLISALM
jgi:3-oxoacyl-[acyl-carrier protein] reductase